MIQRDALIKQNGGVVYLTSNKMKITLKDQFDMTILKYMTDGRIYVSLEDCYGNISTARIPYRDVSSLRFGNEIPRQYLDPRGLLKTNVPIPAVLLSYDSGRLRYALNERILAPRRSTITEEAPHAPEKVGILRRMFNSIFN